MEMAVWQGNPCAGWDVARARIAKMLSRCDGAELLVLPEMYLTGYAIGAQAVAEAGRNAAAMLDTMRDMATKSGTAIAFGAPETGNGGVYNAAFLVDKSGEIAAHCRKTHLYGDVDRAQFLAGETIGGIGTFMGWKVGLAICYDVEFPELARAQALAGAEIIIVPTANMAPYTGVPLRVVPTRAEENEIFVAYANYVGREADFDYCGLSVICGPDGNDIARAGTGETLLRATLDKSAMARQRSITTHHADRRTDLY